MGLRRLARLLLLPAAALALLARVGVRRAKRDAGNVPLSPLSAGWHVGPDWPERAGVLADVESADEASDSSRHRPAGEMDDFSALARPGFDPDRVSPLVREFYERTADFETRYSVHWHAPFRVGAALVSPLTSALGQLNLPGRSGDAGRLHSRFADVRPGADPRSGARAWVRTDEAGDAVFVAVYASHERDGERFVNVAVPLPGGNLSTVLRVDHLADGMNTLATEGGRGERRRTAGRDAGERTGVRLHTRVDGDPGLYLSTPVGPLALPMDQEFRVREAALGRSPALVASHEMWLLGHPFLTITYRIYASTSTS